MLTDSSHDPKFGLAASRAALIEKLRKGEIVLAGTAVDFGYVDFVNAQPGVVERVQPPFQAAAVENTYFLLAWGGYFMLQPMGQPGTYEAHLAFLRKTPPAKVRSAAAKTIDVLKRSGQFKNLVARFDYDRRDVAWLVRDLGFVRRVVTPTQQVWWKKV